MANNKVLLDSSNQIICSIASQTRKIQLPFTDEEGYIFKGFIKSIISLCYRENVTQFYSSSLDSSTAILELTT